MPASLNQDLLLLTSWYLMNLLLFMVACINRGLASMIEILNQSLFTQAVERELSYLIGNQVNQTIMVAMKTVFILTLMRYGMMICAPNISTLYVKSFHKYTSKEENA